MLTKSGVRAVYKTLRIRFKSLFVKKANIVLKYSNHGYFESPLLNGVVYRNYSIFSDISYQTKKQIYDIVGKKKTDEMFLLFMQGANFWGIFMEDKIIGYWWTITAESLGNWYVPLEKDSVIFFAALIFPEWRGYSISPAVLHRIIEKEISDEASIYLDVETWNDSALRAWLKAGFIVIGTYPPLGKQELWSNGGI